ncbi:hypothetical protein NQ318_014077 [Aromia moschata]|uniref:Uncharacterized protein n=1 Tax=Aromia moschata TaxID=1265417 RepID=A0AAV8YYR6_9CUCU|nr:hypothetical protein NQ318_014077 [Aromia moschata]
MYEKNFLSHKERDAEDVIYDEQPVYENALQLAFAEGKTRLDEHIKLNQEFSLNCVQYTDNCEATSPFVVAEVQRLLPTVRRVPYQLLSEIHYLGNNLEVNCQITRTSWAMNNSAIIKNATSCLALKIEQTALDSDYVPTDDSIVAACAKLIDTTKNTYDSSIEILDVNYRNIGS